MSDRRLDRPGACLPAAELAAWQRNLAVIGRALASPDGDGQARVGALAGALERSVGQLNEHRRLKGLRSGAVGAPPQLAWLDRLIAEKNRRRRQLSRLGNAGLEQAPMGVAATPEAQARPARRDPLLTLAEARRLDLDQVRAALEIRDIYEAVSRGLGARTLGLAAPTGASTWREPEMPALLLVARRDRFLPWAHHWRHRDGATLDIVLKLAVFGLSVYALSRRHRMSWGHCLQKLSSGLDLYWEFGAPQRAIGDSPGIPRRGCP